MSTRCNIKIIDNNKNEMWFYKHSDGYPEGTLPVLNVFMTWLKEGSIRSNLSQGAGWLIYAGMKEYGIHDPAKDNAFDGWKVGSIEPTTGQHGDIEYLYEINIVDKTLTVKEI